MAAPKTVSGSLYGYANNYTPTPVVKNVTPGKLPTGMTINQGQSDSDYEKFLTGGGAWGQGNYTPETVNSFSNQQTTSTPAVVGKVEGHWNIPDYAALLAGDWEPNDAVVTGQKMRGEAEAGFQSALRRAFIDFGGDSSKLGNWAKYIDQPTIEAAQTNKFSATAQNLAAATRAQAQASARRAAQGMTRSGATTQDARQVLEAKQLADVTAGRQFTDIAETGERGLGTVEGQIAQMIDAARSRAAARIAEQNPHTWDPGSPGYTPGSTTTTTESGSSSSTGVPGAAAAPWGGITWGGTSGITTKAQLQKKLGYNQTLAQWAAAHPAAWAKLT